MNELENLIKKIKDNPESTEFSDVIEIVEQYYNYSPTHFINGIEDDNVVNTAGVNEGSCKIFSFARIHQLDEQQTLNCFGKYYREDVLENPESSDHANIRTFMKYGWKQIKFDNDALARKQD